MKSSEIEKLLLSELQEVHGGNSSKDCNCLSGAAETIITVPTE